MAGANFGPFPAWMLYVIIAIGIVIAVLSMLPRFKGGYDKLEKTMGPGRPYEGGNDATSGGR